MFNSECVRTIELPCDDNNDELTMTGGDCRANSHSLSTDTERI